MAARKKRHKSGAAHMRRAYRLRPSKVRGRKAGPNGSFPVGDRKHAALAIGGATRSYRAGHISKATMQRIQAKARAVLKRGK